MHTYESTQNRCGRGTWVVWKDPGAARTRPVGPQTRVDVGFDYQHTRTSPAGHGGAEDIPRISEVNGQHPVSQKPSESPLP